MEDLTFDLGQMKSLEVLLLESIRIQQLEGRHCLPGQLIKLEVRRSLKLLQVSMALVGVLAWVGVSRVEFFFYNALLFLTRPQVLFLQRVDL